MSQYEAPSYAAIHWPDQGGELEPYHPWLPDVARMQDTLFSAANMYAGAGNYDHANRVVEAGGNIVDLALAVCHQEAASESQKMRYDSKINSHLSQALHAARDRVRIPHGRRHEYYATNGSDELPDELGTLFQGVWQVFKNSNNVELRDLAL